MKRSTFAAFTAMLLLGVLPAVAQVTARPPVDTSHSRAWGTIDGVISDTGLAPLRAAFVSILRTNIRVGTGPNGRFRITKVPAGQYILIVKRGGYRPTSEVIDVSAGDTLNVAYTLTPDAVTLPGVTVTAERKVSARLADFEQRRKEGQGEFMDREEIEKRNSVFSTELLRKFKTVNVSPNRNTSSQTLWYALSRREGSNFLTTNACAMQVYLDNIPMPNPFNLDLLPSPRDLAGIEVYAGPATTPPQYMGFNKTCGVILVWTRDGY